MAKNIYDLFNERKYGVDYLVEGYEYDEDSVEAYESLEASIEAIEAITQESMNETIELQSAFYLENLVIENMMFNDFDEQKLQSVMEGSVRDKIQAAKDKVQHWWKKMKEWFVGTFKAIANHFKSGETLVKQNGKKIDEGMRRSNLKVKMNKYRNLDAAMDAVNKMIEDLKVDGITDAKKEDAREEILSAVGADDRKDVAEVVKKLFIEEENEEQNISSIPVEVAKNYAGNKSKIIDKLKKQQKSVDDAFRKTLQGFQEMERTTSGEVNELAGRLLANFNFALGIKNTILSTQMAIVKKACNDYTVVIRRALNAPANKRADKKALKDKSLEAFIPNFDGDELDFYEN